MQNKVHMQNLVFENQVLRKIYRPKMNGIIGQFKMSHNELDDLYRLPSVDNWLVGF
jgi:hypothetical protein